MTDFAWIVVGAGPAGCMVARQLVDLTGRRIAVVEDASPATAVPTVHKERPADWLRLLGTDLDWDFETQPADQLSGRRLRWPRGKGLGGSSRINAMICFPPTHRDWETLCHHATENPWGHTTAPEQTTATDWTADQLSRCYAAVEQLVRPDAPRWISDTARWFLDFASDHCAETDQPMLYQRFNRNGKRWDASELIADQVGWVGNQKAAPQVIDGQVEQLIFRQQRAVGVRVVAPDGSQTNVFSEHGIILCAGTLGSPAILMRSGFGRPDELSDLGIDCRQELPGLGMNLQDHLLMPMIYRTMGENFSVRSGSPRSLAQWESAGAGRSTCNIAECGGLFQEGSIQLHVTPTHYLTYPTVSPNPVMTLGINLTRPRSRGCVRLESNQLAAPPRIDPGYFSEASDQQEMIDAIRWLRQWIDTDSSRNWIVEELLPGPRRVDDRSLVRSLGRYGQTLYHPVGTCALGNRATACVDPGFRVRGTAGLWCVDASILPEISTGNPTTIVMTLAYLAAEKIVEQTE